jgi:predicted nucleotidyltransferase
MSERMAFLKENSEAIKAIAARHKAFNVAVFGSVARGEDGPDSDVDFLVDFLPGASLSDEFRLENELREFLKIPVDLISRGGLKARDSHIREEAMAL